jgi:hypothetical protein
LLFFSYASKIPLKEISHLIYRKSRSSDTVAVKLKKGRLIKLYLYELKENDKKVNWFREQGVDVKKTSFMSFL